MSHKNHKIVSVKCPNSPNRKNMYLQNIGHLKAMQTSRKQPTNERLSKSLSKTSYSVFKFDTTPLPKNLKRPNGRALMGVASSDNKAEQTKDYRFIA